ncbi:hypothetical protein [Vibrio breoganii]|uniref:hypothetical protein n=1 Tax=Vibrio breoganii TaxID=553239 RepID=UPI000C81E676|nr:hypothetical protein [Vibrio breoganii]PMK57584.1 hypothetical protein BCT98_08555 [Vibrio breoganii]
MSKKRLSGKELDQYIQNELLMMVREGLEKSPITASTVHARLVTRGLIKGGLSTLSTAPRKKMIEDARQRQHNTSEFTDEEHENFAKGRVSKAYVQKADRYKEELNEFKKKYERNVLAVADIVHYVDTVTPLKVEQLLAEDLIRELATAKKRG